VLGKLWEAISPDPMLSPFETDYRWLTQVYVSVQPTSGTGKLSGTRSAPRPSS
jgi:type I restriction enzyme R subunit